MDGQERHALGIDLGGTKCAGGVLAMPSGHTVCRTVRPTRADRGGEAVLSDVLDLARDLRREAEEQGCIPDRIGLGVAELVSDQGDILSGATISWRGFPVGHRIETETGLPVRVEADVRAAARGESVLGAGRGLGSFVYVTIGTGISAALVFDGQPYRGARGLTGTFASSRSLIIDDQGRMVSGPALEQLASGPAITNRYAERVPGFAGSTADVVKLAESDESDARDVVESAGLAVGSVIALLVNLLDPEAVVIGGGLGLVEGLFRASIVRSSRLGIWSEVHRELPIVSSRLGPDAGWKGAAVASMRFEASSKQVPDGFERLSRP